MIPMVLKIYQDFAATEGWQMGVGAIVLCGGTEFFQPREGKNTYGYGVYPKIHGNLAATIYYMNLRTYGKGFDRYRQQAETAPGIHFERGRIHSVAQDTSSGDLTIRSVNLAGETKESRFDMVVLAVGQRPVRGASELAEMFGIELNDWGFGQTEPFFPVRTGRSGIVFGGAFSGLKDIGDSVIHASAAAVNASRVIHAGGGSLALEPRSAAPPVDVMRQLPKILVVVCTCGEKLSQIAEPQEIAQQLKNDPLMTRVEFLAQTCTATGWESLVQLVETSKLNRILIGACLPYVYQHKIKKLSRQVGLDDVLMEVVDIRPAASANNSTLKVQSKLSAFSLADGNCKA